MFFHLLDRSWFISTNSASVYTRREPGQLHRFFLNDRFCEFELLRWMTIHPQFWDEWASPAQKRHYPRCARNSRTIIIIINLRYWIVILLKITQSCSDGIEMVLLRVRSNFPQFSLWNCESADMTESLVCTFNVHPMRRQLHSSKADKSIDISTWHLYDTYILLKCDKLNEHRAINDELFASNISSKRAKPRRYLNTKQTIF